MNSFFALLMTFVASSSLSLPAFAADECKSVWLYKPFKSCATAANGLDLSQPGTSTVMNMPSDWLGGGKDQAQVCRDVASKFSEQNAAKGLQAVPNRPTPVGEKGADRLIVQEYKYTCELKVTQYPFKTGPNSACGTEEKTSYKVGGSAAGLEGAGVTCLSCDNLSDQPPTAMVNCLRENITQIVEPKAIDLRDSDYGAISAQVRRMLTLSRQVPIDNLRTTDQLSLFTEFLRDHPPQNEPAGGWGGLGNRPTQQ